MHEADLCVDVVEQRPAVGARRSRARCARDRARARSFYSGFRCVAGAPGLARGHLEDLIVSEGIVNPIVMEISNGTNVKVCNPKGSQELEGSVNPNVDEGSGDVAKQPSEPDLWQQAEVVLDYRN